MSPSSNQTVNDAGGEEDLSHKNWSLRPQRVEWQWWHKFGWFDLDYFDWDDFVVENEVFFVSLQFRGFNFKLDLFS